MRGKYGVYIGTSTTMQSRRDTAVLCMRTQLSRRSCVLHIEGIYMADKKPTTSYKEVKIRNTLYRVTSVFSGEKDLGKTLEQLAIRRAMAELTSCPAGS